MKEKLNDIVNVNINTNKTEYKKKPNRKQKMLTVNETKTHSCERKENMRFKISYTSTEK